MKTRLILFLSVVLLLTGCETVRVSQDYMIGTNFKQYQTYAYYKPGIDEADISDMDKRRILQAIDRTLQAKGFKKNAQNPDLLVSFFTETRERVDVYNNWGWGAGWGWGGWGWGGWGWGMGNSVSRTPEGTLFIDFVDAGKNELIWQGVGSASLYQSPERKTERINEIVNEILAQYPPGKEDQD